MENQKPKRKSKGLSLIAVVSFLVSIAFCTFLISATIINRTNVVKLRIEQQIFEKTHRISEVISKLLYKTQALSAMIVQGNGGMDSFDIIAPTLVDDPAIQNVILAPDGIVAKVFPLAGNERIIGWNYFSDGAGNLEAIAARDLGELVLGGPIEIVQGGIAIFGRLPVFIDTPDEDHKFWGLVSVTLKLQQVLDYAELEIFSSYGYSYELWRISPDTNERQVIQSSYGYTRPNFNFLEKPVQIFNAEWYLRVSPILMWYSYPENIALVIAGFCISLIVLFVMQNNFELRNMQSVFELMAITDPLTGIFNRRHFLEIVRIGIEKARRLNENCYFIMFDIDKFKNVNDTYGHQIGDKVLMDITARIKTNIRPYDLFARYGGEEFIIFTAGISKKEVCDMTERLRLSLCSRKYEYGDISFDSSASFGIAQMDDYNLDKAIKYSDDALYMAKRNGRNCVVFYNDSSGG
jgi:diguanylate cyclase (GGDEF)-like protein